MKEIKNQANSDEPHKLKLISRTCNQETQAQSRS